jgi:hypothetical protein
MTEFPNDPQEMTPVDERVYEAVLEAYARGHAPSAADLDHLLPDLGRTRLEQSLTHLVTTTGFLDPVRVRGVERYHPVEGARAPAAT